MKRDSLIWAVLLGLLLLGMILTLVFGRGRSRHGYGLQVPDRAVLCMSPWDSTSAKEKPGGGGGGPAGGPFRPGAPAA
ncbi:hypothetical protein [Trichloromonas sp.]|uniref:hypothetical protein n=1 Tax=Trichloromonas sp. TaxID=3069249 RepID=UPI003D813B70